MSDSTRGLDPRSTWLLRNDRAAADQRLDDAIAELQLRDWPMRPVDLEAFSGASFAEKLAHMLSAATAEGIACIAACGGDGTQHALARAMYLHEGELPALAPLPYGTGNDLCRSLDRLEMEPLKQLESAMLDRPQAIDLLVTRGVQGRVDVILNTATWGSAAKATGQADGETKAQLGWLAYVAQGLSNTQIEPFGARLTLDGRCVHEGDTLFFSLSNGRTTGGGWVVAPSALLDDGAMDLRLLAADEAMTPAVVEQIVRRMRGPVADEGSPTTTTKEPIGHAEALGEGTLQGKELELELDGTPACNLDGEAASEPIERVSVVPAAIRVVAGGSRACVQEHPLR